MDRPSQAPRTQQRGVENLGEAGRGRKRDAVPRGGAVQGLDQRGYLVKGIDVMMAQARSSAQPRPENPIRMKHPHGCHTWAAVCGATLRHLTTVSSETVRPLLPIADPTLLPRQPSVARPLPPFPPLAQPRQLYGRDQHLAPTPTTRLPNGFDHVQDCPTPAQHPHVARAELSQL